VYREDFFFKYKQRIVYGYRKETLIREQICIVFSGEEVFKLPNGLFVSEEQEGIKITVPVPVIFRLDEGVVIEKPDVVK
jgi:hypothetical protein